MVVFGDLWRRRDRRSAIVECTQGVCENVAEKLNDWVVFYDLDLCVCGGLGFEWGGGVYWAEGESVGLW